jgi:hypothetical protein
MGKSGWPEPWESSTLAHSLFFAGAMVGAAPNRAKKFPKILGRGAQVSGTKGGGRGARCSRTYRIFFAGTAFGSSYAGAPSSSRPRPPMKGGYFARASKARRFSSAISAADMYASPMRDRCPCPGAPPASRRSPTPGPPRLPARRRRGASYTLTGEPAPLGLALVSVVSRSAAVIFANGPPKTRAVRGDRP